MDANHLQEIKTQLIELSKSLDCLFELQQKITMIKANKKPNKKKWNFEKFELVRVVWDDATADESSIGAVNEAKLAVVEIYNSIFNMPSSATERLKSFTLIDIKNI